MWQAINSGKENIMKKSLNENAVIIIELLRKHIKDEDEVLYTITLQEFTSEELKELWEKSGK
jgi:hemerythrin-like domain-containing protein